ncbi:MAG: uracil phosphoribosyltransferase [Pseudomonadota bacterium]
MKNPVLEHLLCKLRDPETDRKEFRETLEEVGRQLGTEIARDLPTCSKAVKTVMNAEACHNVVEQDPLLMPILRAGIPLGYGLHKVFPHADMGFIGAMRNEESPHSEAKVGYTTTPEEVKDRYLILIDTMIATGGSILETVKIMERLEPRKIILATAIAAQKGLDAILSYNPDIDVYAAAIDPYLNSNNYIVPGLGDAGDRCYGGKREKFL